MDNVSQDGNENQYVTSTSGEALGKNVNVRRSERIRNSPHNPPCGPVGMVGHVVSEGHDHDISLYSLDDHTLLGVSRPHGPNLALCLFVGAHLN